MVVVAGTGLINNHLFKTLERLSNEAYAVGGAVRDTLLGVEPRDIDYYVVVDSVKKTVEEFYDEFGYPDNELQLENGDVVLLYPGWDVRIAKDWGDPEKNQLWFSRSADFTVNSMLMDGDGNVIDPLLVGEKHLRKKIIVPVRENIFKKEPRTIIRAYRLKTTRSFKLPSGTRKLIYSVPPATISKIHPFLVYVEFEKAYNENPEKGLELFKLLIKEGILNKHAVFRKCTPGLDRGYKRRFNWFELSGLPAEFVYASFFLDKHKEIRKNTVCTLALPSVARRLIEVYNEVLMFTTKKKMRVAGILENYNFITTPAVRRFLNAVVPMNKKKKLECFYKAVKLLGECVEELYPDDDMTELARSRVKKSKLKECVRLRLNCP